jgi:hypothetical protein
MAAGPARADMVVLGAVRDNTLFDSPTGDLSNGAGYYLFAGTTAGDLRRRALIAFDVAGNLPAGATIDSAVLTLNMSRTATAAEFVELHRVLADWGEGTSQASGHEGAGAPAASDDATWIHRFYPNELWANPGGDFSQLASGSQVIGGNGFYSWGPTPEMTADVQSWLDAPAANFGWLLKGNEAFGTTAKRFDSREHPDPSVRPLLTITYTPVPEPGTALLVASSLLMPRRRRRSRRAG